MTCRTASRPNAWHLQQRLNEIAADFNRAMVGTCQRVLVERVSRKSAAELSGRASNNRIVVFPGDAALVGRFVEVEITATGVNSLRGEIVAAPALAGQREAAANWN